ncbi:MAG: HAD-IC family P-type ATPase [Thermoleophilia bacterium]
MHPAPPAPASAADAGAGAAPPTGDAGGWHAIDAADALARLGSSPAGLASAAARRELDRHGPNELPRQPSDGLAILLWRQVAQPLIAVLLVAAAVTGALGHWIDAGVILGVVVANALVGVVQERRAGRAVEALLELVALESTVVRDGVVQAVDARELVPGDVVVLDAGDKVPADCRLLEARGLLVDEALLTGESVPVEKLEAGALPAETPLPERRNLVFAGTRVTGGQGRAAVVATASATELGRISALVGAAEPLATPLTRRIAAFSRTLTIAISALAALTFGIAWLRGYELLDGFLAAVALAVSAIPEGLPAIMTIALAAGVRRMAARNAVVRRLPAVETLGSTTVICSDKTGTLTRSEMVVVEAYAGQRIELTGSGYRPSGALLLDGRSLAQPPSAVAGLLEAALLCSDARLVESDEGWRVEGDPTEGAIVAAAGKAGIDRDRTERLRPRLDALPFESERRFMATLHATEAIGPWIVVKGAPEEVIARCETVAWNERLDARAVLEEAERMAGAGQRVLAVAAKSEEGPARALERVDLEDGFTLLGLLGLFDPPREEAVRAVAACHSAGIRVAMMTGDHPRTAAAIARAVGIEAGVGRALTGAELDRLTDDELAREAATASVFARVAPEHKLRLVRALQGSGEIVAMTGDGVNDAPALRQADIGVAMGVSGTDVSKEAADMVLRDDDFATIEAAIEEGRRVYDNLIKSIVFILPTSAGESLLVLLAIALGLTLPVLPVQILWINLVTTVALALPLALEAREPDTMRRPPRRLGEPVLGRLAIQRIGLVALLMFGAGIGVFEWEQARGATVEEARTTVIATIVLIEALYLLNCRSLARSAREVGLLANPSVYWGIALVVALQLAFTYVPFMNTLFETEPIGGVQWLVAAGVATGVMLLIALEKRLGGAPERRRGSAGRPRTPGR